LQSHWPLAAKFGTWLADSLQGSEFAYVGYNGGGGGGGGASFMSLLLDAVFLLHNRDIEIIKNDLFILVCNWWRWLLYCYSSYFYFGFEIYPFLT
jgi:hypothetical protein